MSKNSLVKTACKDERSYVALQKLSKIKKGDITCQHIDSMTMC